jgi:hypothetical protein
MYIYGVATILCYIFKMLQQTLRLLEFILALSHNTSELHINDVSDTSISEIRTNVMLNAKVCTYQFTEIH